MFHTNILFCIIWFEIYDSIHIPNWKMYAQSHWSESFLSDVQAEPTDYEGLRRQEMGLTSDYAGLSAYQNTGVTNEGGGFITHSYVSLVTIDSMLRFDCKKL